MITSEDLLIWGRRQADPWNRLGNKTEPVLIVIEFCQASRLYFLNLIDIIRRWKVLVLWLFMVSVKRRILLSIWMLFLCGWWAGNTIFVHYYLFSCLLSETSSGSISVLYNQESALHAVAFYCTVYDVQARAFQVSSIIHVFINLSIHSVHCVLLILMVISHLDQ